MEDGEGQKKKSFDRNDGQLCIGELHLNCERRHVIRGYVCWVSILFIQVMHISFFMYEVFALYQICLSASSNGETTTNIQCLRECVFRVLFHFMVLLGAERRRATSPR